MRAFESVEELAAVIYVEDADKPACVAEAVIRLFR